MGGISDLVDKTGQIVIPRAISSYCWPEGGKGTNTGIGGQGHRSADQCRQIVIPRAISSYWSPEGGKGTNTGIGGQGIGQQINVCYPQNYSWYYLNPQSSQTGGSSCRAGELFTGAKQGERECDETKTGRWSVWKAGYPCRSTLV
jgi:hypothetical protein